MLAPTLVIGEGGSLVSAGILRIAAISDVFLSLFLANSLFIMVFNRPNWLAILASIGFLIVGVGGFFLARFGFENIIYAYLFATISVAALSFIPVKSFLKKPASLFFARFA